MYRLFRVDYNGTARYVIERDGGARLLEGDIYGTFTEGDTVDLGGLRTLPPVVPSKIVCVGRNYRDHAAEMKSEVPTEPLIFLKPPSVIVGPGDSIQIPDWAGRVDHEAELAVVIGKRASRVRAADASAYVFGVTGFNDVTSRTFQTKDGQWTRGKGFDTFGPIGPCVAVGLDASDLEVRADVNGDLRQRGRTRDLIFSVPTVIEFVTAVMTLYPGDVIATGTPAGVGPLRAGDRVTIYIEGVGALSNDVVTRAN